MMARSKKPQVAISYEHVGRDVWEPIHLELDSKKMILGLNQIEIKVTDLSSGQSVKREAIFRLEPAPQVAERQRQNQDNDVQQGRRERRGDRRR